jgi:hypothetical protein
MPIMTLPNATTLADRPRARASSTAIRRGAELPGPRGASAATPKPRRDRRGPQGTPLPAAPPTATGEHPARTEV